MPQMQSIQWLNQAAAGTQGSDLLVYLPAIIALVAGIVLLLAGGKVLRPVAVLLGGAAGAVGGSILLPGFLPDSVYAFSGQTIGTALGTVVGMVGALVLFRAAMAAAGAATFGVAGVLVAGVWAGGVPVQMPSLAGIDREAAGRVVMASFPLQQADQQAATAAAGEVVHKAWGDLSSAWDSMPADSRLRLIVAGLGAGMLGLVVGALMPRKAAALVTALTGAGVCLVSLTWLARTAEWPGRELLEHGPMGWLAIWAVVAGAGLVFQLCGKARPAKPKPAPAQ